MKTASTRKLFAYWNERRGSRLAPERGEIEPVAIRQVLGDSFVLAFDPVADHPFRLAGTRVCALFCNELKSESFGRLWDRASQRVMREMVSVVAEEAVAMLAGVRGLVAAGPAVDLELLLLPLYHRGRRDIRMLGALTPVAIPYWLGVMPVEQLMLTTMRHLGADSAPLSAPTLVPATVVGRRRGRLIVLDGGRS